MTPDEAEWVRSHVWTKSIRKDEGDGEGGYRHTCACQWGPTTYCQQGNHEACHRVTPQLGSAGFVTRKNATVCYFPEPYAHPYLYGATSPHEEWVAMWWYADRLCAWKCSCECHAAGQVLEPGRLELFDVA